MKCLIGMTPRGDAIMATVRRKISSGVYRSGASEESIREDFASKVARCFNVSVAPEHFTTEVVEP